jgi:RHS repeat-associated protein
MIRDNVGNVVTYAGRDIDPLTGLYYNRRRWYDAGTGGFIGPDPLGFAAGDTNLYRYCGNSPLRYTDPMGLSEAPTNPPSGGGTPNGPPGVVPGPGGSNAADNILAKIDALQARLSRQAQALGALQAQTQKDIADLDRLDRKIDQLRSTFEQWKQSEDRRFGQHGKWLADWGARLLQQKGRLDEIGQRLGELLDWVRNPSPSEAFMYSWGASFTSVYLAWKGIVTWDDAPWDEAYNIGPLGQTQHSTPVYYWGTRAALAVASASAVAAAAVGIGEFFLLGNTSILAEGVLMGGRMGSGGIFQLRPDGSSPWFRFDLHPFKPGGPAIPHVDSPPLGWHHWPWQ